MSTKVLLFVEIEDTVIEFLKKKISEPRGQILMQLDRNNCIVYNVIENINENCIIHDLSKGSCPYSYVIDEDVTCFVDKYAYISQYPHCNVYTCPKRIIKMTDGIQ